MLKLISISQLQMGMYIHQFCGSWLDHSFWKAGFVLDSPQDYQRLQHSNLTRLWIDSAKGRDLLEQPPQTSPDSLPPGTGPDSAPATTRVAMGEEIQRALKLCAHSKKR